MKLDAEQIHMLREPEMTNTMRTNDDQFPPSERGPATITVRQAHDAIEAERLVPVHVLGRLCAVDGPSRVRPSDIYSAPLIVALVNGTVVGFAAYQTGRGPVGVAHELWVDRDTRAGAAAVTQAILTALESAVTAAAGSRLVVSLPVSSPLRELLEDAGYHTWRRGATSTWFAKSMGAEDPPLESA